MREKLSFPILINSPDWTPIKSFHFLSLISSRFDFSASNTQLHIAQGSFLFLQSWENYFCKLFSSTHFRSLSSDEHFFFSIKVVLFNLSNPPTWDASLKELQYPLSDFLVISSNWISLLLILLMNYNLCDLMSKLFSKIFRNPLPSTVLLNSNIFNILLKNNV